MKKKVKYNDINNLLYEMAGIRAEGYKLPPVPPIFY
jgi:hypothetical protein